MKILLTSTLMALSLSSNAFFNNTNFNGWNSNGNQEDNGIVAYNPYNFFDPRWAVKETLNVMDEIDNKISDNDDNAIGSYLMQNTTHDFPAPTQASIK